MDDIKSIWEEALSYLSLEISRPGFETWIKTLKPLTLEGSKIVLQTPNKFSKDWLEEYYLPLIEEVIRKVTQKDFKVEILAEEKEENIPEDKKVEYLSTSYNNLNPKYTFDTFVVGDSNRFAHAAALAVSQNPGKAYNPLLIYGGVGLGKTHLIHAIGHSIQEKYPKARVVYASMEKFTVELIDAIKEDGMTKFRNRYRNIDVLLIDDIQFLAGKERTQEEFFYTFNALYEAGKQIVLTSDRVPKEIPTLEDRLRSRFEWGLIADIQPPDLETRIAILKKKAEAEKAKVPDEVIEFIASQIQSNIRELEGALIRTIAFASLNNMPINLELAKTVLKDIIQPQIKNITIQNILQAVAEYFNITVEQLKGKGRSQEIAVPRQIAMYLARTLTDLSLPKIGEELGGRDHTTVLHAYEKIQELYQTDLSIKKAIQDIQNRLRNSNSNS
ncbi:MULTISPECIES: chromosomal replication initiator protein DnaA [Dictyoglomus]|jgi:chromosomal replication initiator protein|uniref:Chromosomal replication initiator protein DnaA n=1 Tax=Dictyoglomus turgidum (strain DSM 6724 / Z-1310) TaxID=515635 RepID=B8DYG0_DICTD|nr:MULTISPECIES: chromosomal replication initiator protein DnaA [Dictyoglomus]ACK41342.1 chromosomal replication initiator protein DnaA [Dictyoglomus turgidum DSM 6724]PNV79262.1 MAG: chromosomal replication initiator protein DnaA [Dictyoglomus turgidum]HBU31653.1 chromosomal replication initiator protein DnaA [Dictyoglomus sp.]